MQQNLTPSETVVWTAYAAAAAVKGLSLRDEPAEVSLMGTRLPNPFPRLANVAADLAAMDAFTAGVDAARAASFADEFIERAMQDYQALLKLRPDCYPDAC